MSRRIIEFDEPERFTAGTLGEPGELTFVLQAVQGRRVSSVILEEEQVTILADRLIVLIDELERRGLAAIDAGPASVLDERPLGAPSEDGFRVETLAIGWDESLDRLVIEARSETLEGGAGERARPLTSETDDEEMEAEDEVPDDAPIGPDVLRVRLTPPMAQRFARHAARIAAPGGQARPS